MSGIYGYISNKKNNVPKEDLSSLERWNKAYGEDAKDSFSSEEASLGCFIERLSDKKPACKGVIQKGSIYAVIDAVIYNRGEIAAKYGINESLCDEEMLLELILNKGKKAMAAVNGDFAGAVYDQEKKTLLLFRDHMGVRPLFYHATVKGVAFSTDIRGILGLGFVEKSIYPQWAERMLKGAFATVPTRTEYRHVFAVRPGSWLEFRFVENGIYRKELVYWKVGRRKIRMLSDKAYQKKMRELITDAVKIRLDAVSGKVGAELSGGIDSGVIDILINRLGRDCVYYSWSKSPEELSLVEKDERLVIKDICDQEGITCSYGERPLDETSILYKKTLEAGINPDSGEKEAIRYLLPAYVNTLPISSTAEFARSNGARAVFTGHGGDEGVSHRCNPYEMFYFHEYYHYFRYMFSTTHGQKNRVKKTLDKCRYNLTTERKALENPGEGRWPNYFAYNPIAYINTGGTRNRLDNVALLGAYSGVRYMIPFVDYRVIDFAVSIPRYQYLRGRKDRYIFREAFKDIMPDALYRQRLKEDMSAMSIKEEQDWFPEFDELRRSTVERLNRDYWKDVMDFEELEAWALSGRPSENDRPSQEFRLICLFQCLVAQNLVDKLT